MMKLIEREKENIKSMMIQMINVHMKVIFHIVSVFNHLTKKMEVQNKMRRRMIEYGMNLITILFKMIVV
jgi:hypothetical protein